MGGVWGVGGNGGSLLSQLFVLLSGQNHQIAKQTQGRGKGVGVGEHPPYPQAVSRLRVLT